MAASFGLSLYNIAAGRKPAVAEAWPKRPGGRMVWLHTPDGGPLSAMLELARHLIEEDGFDVVLTTPHAVDRPTEALVTAPPPDHPQAVQAFLAHWRPEVAVFSDGELRPAALQDCMARHLPVLMVDARAPALMKDRAGWYPGLIGQSLAAFHQILALNDEAAKALRRAGADPARITVAGRMEEASAALPHVEADRAALANVLATRPVWLAAGVAPEEEAAVIAAHREVLRLAHRLLLILVPQDPGRAADLAQRIEDQEGWRVALRRAEQEPDTETEVYVAEDGEYGLWYRLAPVTFMGGSLDGTGCLRDPMEPAALGSAILCGPRPGNFGLAYGRLAAARAARMVGSGGDLSLALGDFLAPDRAARQAQAAWTIASDGADVTQRVIGMIRSLMDGS